MQAESATHRASLPTIDGHVFRFNLEAIDAKRSRLRFEQSSREHIIRTLTRSRLELASQMTPPPVLELTTLDVEEPVGVVATRVSAVSYAPVRSPASFSTCRGHQTSPHHQTQT